AHLLRHFEPRSHPALVAISERTHQLHEPAGLVVRAGRVRPAPRWPWRLDENSPPRRPDGAREPFAARQWAYRDRRRAVDQVGGLVSVLAHSCLAAWRGRRPWAFDLCCKAPAHST